MKLPDWQLIKWKKEKTKGIVSIFSKYVLLLILFVAIFNSILSNDKPIVCNCAGEWQYPAVRDFFSDMGWVERNQLIYNADRYKACKNFIYPPVKFHYSNFGDNNDRLLPPGSKSSSSPNKIHLLGTDKFGRDVSSGLIRGAYISIKIGLLSTFFACILGVFLGVFSGYYGDRGLMISPFGFLIFVLIAVYAVYLLVYGKFGMTWIFLFLLLIALVIIFKVLRKMMINLFSVIKTNSRYNVAIFLFSNRWRIPLDIIIQRLIELRKSVPTLVLLLACLPLFSKASHTNLVILITAFGWHSFTRYSRAETLRLREVGFIKSIYSLGLSDSRIIWRHLIPNTISVLLPVFIFSLGTNLILESSLSFLGIGLPFGEVSWGTMISDGRKTPDAWWLVFFPGLMIFTILISINSFAQLKFLNSRKRK